MKGEKQNMNKFLTKIAKLTLGLAMAAGAGVAISTKSSLNEVKADDVSYTYTLTATDWSTSVDKTTSISWSSSTAFDNKYNDGACVSSTKTAVGVSSAAFTNLKSVALRTKRTSAATGTAKAYYKTTQNGSYTQIGSTITVGTSFSNTTLNLPSTESTAWVKIEITRSSSGGNVYLNSITVTCEGSGGGGGGDSTDTYNLNGKNIILSSNGKYIPKTIGTSGRPSVEQTKSNSAVFLFTKVGSNQFTLSLNSGVSNDGMYLTANASTGSNSSIYLSETEATWTVVTSSTNVYLVKTNYLGLNGTTDWRMYASNSGNKAPLTFEDAATLNSVTTASQTTSFIAGNKFAYGGTLTAHYTNGKADATVTPSSYKFGASGINPTTSGTSITTNTTLTKAEHDGKYIYVIYTEDNVTKYCSYQITVNYAAVTSVVIDTHAAEIGLNKTYDYTLVGVTVNTLYADQGYEWIVHANTVSNDYTFDGSGLKSKDTEGTITLRCRSTADNSKYDELVVTVSGNPTAEFTPASVSGYVGKGTSVAFTYGNMDDTSKISVLSSDASVTVGAISASAGEGSVAITFVSVGSATLSISYDSGSALDTVGVTVSADSVTALTWSAPTINVYSGAITTVSDASSWNVHYTMTSGDEGDLSYGEYTLKLGESSITLPHEWTFGDDGKTLGVQYEGVNSTTTVVSVAQTLRPITKTTYSTATKSWAQTTTTAAFDKDATSVTLAGVVWSKNTLSGNITVQGRDSDRYLQIGGSKAPETLVLRTSNISGTITKITINCGKGSNGTSTIQATVNGVDYIPTQVMEYLNASAPAASWKKTTDIVGTGKQSGEIVITMTGIQNSGGGQTYLHEITVEYSTGSTTSPIANVAGHEAAQKAVGKFAVAFNSAMDATEGCTSNLSTVWNKNTEGGVLYAWNQFKSQISSLSSAEKEWAYDLIREVEGNWTKNTDSDYTYCLERAMATYDICVSTKHNMTNFMTDDSSKALRSASVVPTNNIFGLLGSTNTAVIIVIVSLVSVSAIGGYFFLRKRKEN